MRRRDFLKTTGTVLAATSFGEIGILNASETAQSRWILPLNRNWRYRPAKVAGAEMPTFDDAAFERVTIPHSNIQLPWHNFDNRQYEFISTYRRKFKYPPMAAGKRVFVDFEGAMTASTVWINGIPLRAC